MIYILLSAMLISVTGSDSLNAFHIPPDSASISNTPEISSSSKPYQMKGLVVTASRTPLSLRAAPASVSVLEYDSLTPGVAAAVQLSQMPGASLGSTGGLGSVATLSLRGGEANSTLYLLDGLPLNSAQNGQFDLNKIFDIQRVEIVRGPASSLYGANAAAGVINIITGVQSREKPYSKVNFEKGSNNSQVWDASVSLPLAQWAWSDFGMAWKKTGGYRVNSDYDGTNYFLSLRARPVADIEAKIYYKEYKSECGAPGPDSLLFPASYRLLPWYQPTPHDRQYDKQRDFNFKLSYKEQNFIAVSRNSIDNDFYSEAYGKSKNYALQTNVDGQYSYSFTNRASVIIGAAYQTAISDITKAGTPKLYHRAFFLTGQQEPINQLLLVESFRFDKNNAYPNQISPSVSISYNLTEDLSIYANYGRAYRAPTLNELYWNEPWMYGNPNLEPEKSEQFEAGIKITRLDINMSLAGFRRNIHDLISWGSDPLTYAYTTNNLGKTISRGVEVQAGRTLFNLVGLGLNYTYCQTVQDTLGQPNLPYKPLNVANGSININDFQIVSNLKLGWKFWAQYSDIQTTGSGHPIDLLPATVISNQALSLKIVDARVYYRVENLFNADYQTRYGYPMPRRTHSFGVIFEMLD